MAQMNKWTLNRLGSQAEKLKEKIKNDRYEIGVKSALLMGGVDTENLIYYTHKGEWSKDRYSCIYNAYYTW